MEKSTPCGVIPINTEAAISFPMHRSPFNSRYYLAPAIRAVADTIISRYHPHLQEAAIAYLLRRGAWKRRGHVVTGKAVAAPEQWRYLSGCDLALIINEEVWQGLGNKGREVLLDHELSHFTAPTADKRGNLHWALREHDLQEFSEVVKRHGVCCGDHRRLVAAAGQLDLESLDAFVSQVEESMGGGYDDTEDDNCFTEDDDPLGG